MSITLSGIPASLIRVGVNVVLSYALAGLVLAALSVGMLVAGSWPYSLDPIESWTWTMWWCAIALPLVAGTLAAIDLVLSVLVVPPRLTGFAIALAPGAYLGFFAGFGEPMTIWIIGTGMLFGIAMRVPPRMRRDSSLTGEPEPA